MDGWIDINEHEFINKWINQMDEWIDIDGWMNKWNKWTNRCINQWKNGKIDMNESFNGWMDGQVNKQTWIN